MFESETAVFDAPNGHGSQRHAPGLTAALVLIGFLLALGGLDAFKTWITYRVSGELFPGWRYGVFKTAPWLAWGLLVPGMVMIARNWNVERLGWGGALARYVPLAFLFTLSQMLVAALLRWPLPRHPLYNSFTAQFEYLFPDFLPLGLAVCGGLWASVFAFDYYRQLGHVSSPPRPAGAPSSEPYLSRLTLKHDGRVFFIPTDSIDWIESDGNYVRIHVAGAVYRKRATLAGLLRQLDPARFVRVHRSTVVNLDRVREIQSWFGSTHVAILKGGSRLRVSRQYRAALF